MRALRKLYNLTLSSDKSFSQYLKKLIGNAPSNLSLYKQAFLHSSVANEEETNNERLEFLGDAILGMIVARYLFNKFPDKKEGFLTEMRAKIVSRRQLNDVAVDMGLSEIVNFHPPSNTEKSSIMGNALEALVGAIYVDLGYRATYQFIRQQILEPIDMKELEQTEHNFKSKLLEWGQKGNVRVEFVLLEETSKDGRPFFRVAVMVKGKQEGTAADFNKKRAEQQAAAQAIDSLNIG